MRKIFLLLVALCSTICLSAQTALPYLADTGKGIHLYVDGKPFILFTGELHNSTSTSESYMKEIGAWEQIRRGNFNSIIASCSWNVIEQEEGKYDFTSVDHLIRSARENGIKVVLIWFGSWKNGNSSYAPGYVKRNPKEYPLVKNAEGKYLDVLSTFGQESMKADSRAFAALMRHIREVDEDHTIIMIQAENEIGILGSVRDFSDPAQKAWKGQVPAELMAYLESHQGRLYPELERVWKENGYKKKGTWEEVFGKSSTSALGLQEFPAYTEEIFQAYHYARYVEEVVKAGREELDLPVYVNNWLRQPGMVMPGSFPSGSPLPEVLDIWRAAAPSVDFTAPDIYINEFDWVLGEFSRSGNPIFIPECRGDVSKALYAYGEYDALGFSPFGFDGPQHGGFGVSAEEFENLSQCYGILSGMGDMLYANHASDRMRGLLVTDDDPNPSVEMGDYILTASSSVRNRRAFNYGQGAEQMAQENAALASMARQSAPSGALVIQTSPDEFYIVGINVSFSFSMKDPEAGGSARTDIIEEGTFQDGEWIPGRSLNGDENRVSIMGVGAERVTLYHSPVEPQPMR